MDNVVPHKDVLFLNEDASQLKNLLKQNKESFTFTMNIVNDFNGNKYFNLKEF